MYGRIGQVSADECPPGSLEVLYGGSVLGIVLALLPIMKLDPFTRAFFEAALFSSNDESTEQGGDPLDDNYSVDDFAPATLELLSRECAEFQDEQANLICRDPAQAGHDFWMTRCGHGCGFDDGDWPAYGEHLTRACEQYGDVTLYVGDDRQIHAMGYENLDCEVPNWLHLRHPKRLGCG